MTVFLHNLVFYAYHGLYPEEAITGGKFIVDVEISYSHGKHVIQEISETIDYEAVYRLVEGKMNEPVSLIETLAMEIANLILNSFQLAEKVKVAIEKCNPPILGMQGSVSVEYTTVRYH